MSRIGKKPIAVPSGLKVSISGQQPGTISVEGPKGKLKEAIPPLVSVRQEGTSIVVERHGNQRRARAMHGLCRALIQNMVTGAHSGFERTLDINGVGYRADVKGNMLTLTLGHSHPLEMILPEGVSAKIDGSSMVFSGSDRAVLGQLVAIVREQRPPEPYKGKGVKYREEHIRRKAGKAGAA